MHKQMVIMKFINQVVHGCQMLQIVNIWVIFLLAKKQLKRQRRDILVQMVAITVVIPVIHLKITKY
ncbi:MAG: hypothetical protein A2W90_04985 [Bacteroidetes bacterium GWF2_42_66]|nr:MAG: hypothetical protein A2W89_21205 [Bacteroidetes bacterium GWE2_42_39]OFY40840.1 MAG: hypothetical protein A2W90_04985 [Bacteroidetes bacterium GWF2_42_66]